jgi:outer membrane receptor for ferrienterochelin and colicins
VYDLRTTISGAPSLYASDDLRQTIESTFLRGRFQWDRQFENQAALQVKVGGNYFKLGTDSSLLAFDREGSGLLDESVTSNAVFRSFVSSGKYSLPEIKNHAVSVGWDVERNGRREHRVQAQSAPQGYPATDLDESYEVNISRLAAFAQDQWEVLPSVALYWGARWEGLITSTTGTGMERVRHSSSVLSPVLQLAWKIGGSTANQVRLGLSRSYKAPSPTDLMPRRYVANDNTPTTPDTRGNPDLLPEVAWGVDAAYEHYLGSDAGLFSINTSARRIDNVVVRQLTFTDGRWVARPANEAGALVASIELEGRARLKKLMPSAPSVELRSSLAWNTSRVSGVPSPDNRLDQQRPFSGRIGVDYDAAPAGFKAGVHFAFESSARARVEANRWIVLNPRRVLDLYALWKIEKTQLRVSLNNALRGSATTESLYMDETGSFGQVARELRPASVKVTLEFPL